MTACFANGSAVKLFIIQETEQGEIPATPEFKPIRFVSEGLTPNINQIESNEMHPSRQKPASRGGNYSVQGEVECELSFASFDELMQAAMQGTWSGNALKIGSTQRSFAVLERHTDIGVDYIYRGCRVNTMNLAAPLGDKAKVTFGLIGTKAEVYSVPHDATFADPSDKAIMVTTNGSFTEGGQAIAYATEYSLTLDNGMDAKFALFKREAFCVSNGIATVQGTLSAYLKDGALWAKVLQETPTKHVIVLQEGSDKYTITLPNVRYVQGQKQVAGPDAVIPQYTFSAGYDSAEESTMTIARSA